MLERLLPGWSNNAIAVVFAVVLSLIGLPLFGSVRHHADAPTRTLAGRPALAPASDPDDRTQPSDGSIGCLAVMLLFLAAIGTFEGLGARPAAPDAGRVRQARRLSVRGLHAGQVCSAVAVLGEIADSVPSHVQADLTKKPEVSGDEIRERISGNICRCGGYSNIVDAVAEVAGLRA